MKLEERKSYLMICMADYLMHRWKKTLQEFLHLDSLYGILGYLILGYESFHLTGDEGIAEEVEEFIRLQGGTI